MTNSRNTIKPREFETIERKLKLRSTECKHHKRFYFAYDGKIVCSTHISFGRHDIFGRVLKCIMRDLIVTGDLFFGMIDCYKDVNDYIAYLKARKII
jgi:hypothetical protein